MTSDTGKGGEIGKELFKKAYDEYWKHSPKLPESAPIDNWLSMHGFEAAIQVAVLAERARSIEAVLKGCASKDGPCGYCKRIALRIEAGKGEE